ncbi:MAG: hydroxyethylthiazole kinase [Candidatus Diapherotrites archaeon]
MEIYSLLEKVRTEKPVVHHLTNWVTIYDCANIVKVFGASPVMAHAKEESADMAKIASALVLNIGTLTPEFVESMKIAAKSANEKGISVILDVCGAGATKLRDDTCFDLLNEVKIDIIKGNSSEVARIAGEDVQTKGVDATEVKKDLIAIAKHLASQRECTVVITGKEDIICNSKKCYIVKNGTEIMSHIVGTGCMTTSVIGTFAAVESDLAKASVAGLVCFEIAAELAEKESKGAGTFKANLFDAVYNLKKEEIEKMQKVEEQKFVE